MLDSIYFDVFFSVFPFIGVLHGWKFKLYKSDVGKYIMLLLALHFTIESYSFIHIKMQWGRNVFLNSINDLISLPLITAMIYRFSQNDKIAIFIGGSFTIVVAIIIFFIEGFNNYAPLSYAIQELGIIALCMLYFSSIYKNEGRISAKSKSEFFTVVILLLLNSGSLFTSIMILQITENLTTYVLYDLQLLLDVFCYLLLMGILIIVKKNI